MLDSVTPHFEGAAMSGCPDIVIRSSHYWEVALQSTSREESQCSHYPWATVTPHFEGVAMSDYPNIVIIISSHYWEVTPQSTLREESQAIYHTIGKQCTSPNKNTMIKVMEV